jgi:heme/copper-type cytochrome/quinol oxidase subunit 2
MRLKIATTTFLIAGLLLLAGWPWLVGPMPKSSEVGKRAVQEYAVRFGVYIIVVLIVWFVTAMLAVLVARQARQAFREEAMENFQHLMEETLKDHGKPKS